MIWCGRCEIRWRSAEVSLPSQVSEAGVWLVTVGFHLGISRNIYIYHDYHGDGLFFSIYKSDSWSHDLRRFHKTCSPGGSVQIHQGSAMDLPIEIAGHLLISSSTTWRGRSLMDPSCNGRCRLLVSYETYSTLWLWESVLLRFAILTFEASWSFQIWSWFCSMLCGCQQLDQTNAPSTCWATRWEKDPHIFGLYPVIVWFLVAESPLLSEG